MHAYTQVGTIIEQAALERLLKSLMHANADQSKQCAHQSDINIKEL